MSNSDKIIDRVLYGVDVPIFSRNGDVLMLRRDVQGEDFETGWEYVKGGLKENESFVEAALREAQEEAGNLGYEVVSELDDDYFVDARYRHKPHYDYVKKRAVVLIAETLGVVVDGKEHAEARWMSKKDALDSIWVENGVEILSAAFDAIALHEVN